MVSSRFAHLPRRWQRNIFSGVKPCRSSPDRSRSQVYRWVYGRSNFARRSLPNFTQCGCDMQRYVRPQMQGAMFDMISSTARGVSLLAAVMYDCTVESSYTFCSEPWCATLLKLATICSDFTLVFLGTPRSNECCFFPGPLACQVLRAEPPECTFYISLHIRELCFPPSTFFSVCFFRVSFVSV